MKLKNSILLKTAIVAFAACNQSHGQTIGWNKTAAGTYDYNTGGNWVDGMVNGTWNTDLTLAGAQTVTFGADTVLTTGWTFNYAGNYGLTLRGTGANRLVTLDGNISVNPDSAQTITIGSGSNGTRLNIDLGTANRTVTVAANKELIIRDAISGTSRRLTKSGDGTLTLQGASTYSGGTTVNAGTLKLNGSTTVLGNAGGTLTVNTGGTLDMNNRSATVGNFTGTGGKIVNNGSTTLSTLTIGQNNNGGGNFAGEISGEGRDIAVAKTGSNSITLSGNNTFTGGLEMGGGGQIILGSAGALNSTVGKENAVSWTGSSASGLTLNGNSVVIRSLTNNATWTSNYVQSNLAGTATLTVGNSLNLDSSFSGALQNGAAGTLALTKAGTGTLTLSGTNNSYTGATNVNAGTLNITGSTASGSAVTVGGSAASGTPRLAGSGTVNGAVTVKSAGTGAAGILNAGNSTLANKVGTLAMGSTLAFESGSTFEWDLNVDSDLSTSTYDKVTSAGALTGGAALFKIVLDTGDSFADAFWDSSRSWNDIFGGAGAPSTLAGVFSGFDSSGGISSTGVVTGQGHFTLSNSANSLTWTPIPEPGTALGGLLLTAGLLRRRRKHDG